MVCILNIHNGEINKRGFNIPTNGLIAIAETFSIVLLSHMGYRFTNIYATESVDVIIYTLFRVADDIFDAIHGMVSLSTAPSPV